MKADSKVKCDHADEKCGECLHAKLHEPSSLDCIGEGVCWQDKSGSLRVRFQSVRCRVVKKEKKD